MACAARFATVFAAAFDLGFDTDLTADRVRLDVTLPAAVVRFAFVAACFFAFVAACFSGGVAALSLTDVAARFLIGEPAGFEARFGADFSFISAPVHKA